MANMIEDFATSAAEGVQSFGSKLAQGAGDLLVEGTRIGPLFDPFIETTREKQQAPERQLRAEQIEFQRGQMKRTVEQQSLLDQTRENQRQELAITANREQAEKNTMRMFSQIPLYQNLTDIDQNKLMQSPEVEDLVNFKTLSRIGIQALNDPKKMPTFKRALNSQGMDLVIKDGKSFLIHPEDGAVELNDDNFANLMNGFQAEAAEAVKAQAMYAQQKNNVRGLSVNNMADALIAQSVANNPTGTPKSLATAFKEAETFMKANNFSPQQEHIHWLNTGLQKVFKDNLVTPEEKMEVLNQLQFIGKKIGIVSRPAADPAEIAELQAPNGMWMPLSQYAEELSKPGQDVIADRFKAVMSVGDEGAPRTPFEEEFDEDIAGEIPEENVEAVKASVAPLMEETGIDSKDRKSYAKAVSDMIDFSVVEQDREKQYNQVKALASDFDIDEDKLFEVLPEEIKRPVGRQIAIEAEAEQKRALKEAEEKVKRKEKFTDALKELFSVQTLKETTIGR